MSRSPTEANGRYKQTNTTACQTPPGTDNSRPSSAADQIIDHRIVEAVSTAHSDADATLAVVEGPEAVDYGAVHLDEDTITELIE